MSRVAYVNGRYVRHAEAGVSIDDRAFLFADGIYEVIEIFGGKLIDEAGHLERLARSARELRLATPVGERALRVILREARRPQPRPRRPCLPAGDEGVCAARPFLPQAGNAGHACRVCPRGRSRGGGNQGAEGDQGDLAARHPVEAA